MLGIIDYGVGNLFSLSASLKYLGIETAVTDKLCELDKCDRLILPGVGAFGDAAKKLVESGLDKYLTERANDGTPILGICLGMQLLMEESCEYGRHEGLGLIKGKILPLADKLTDLKIPHIGWNKLIFKSECPILKDTNGAEYVYYVHSYYADGESEYCKAYSDYGVNVAGVVAENNVFGTQFHPEKSGAAGLKILKAFAEFK